MLNFKITITEKVSQENSDENYVKNEQKISKDEEIVENSQGIEIIGMKNSKKRKISELNKKIPDFLPVGLIACDSAVP